MERPDQSSSSATPPAPVDPESLLDAAASDSVAQSLSGNFRCPVRRNYPAGTLSVPAESLMIYDPTTKLGMEVKGIIEQEVAVTTQIWTLVDGSPLVGSVLVHCARSHGFPRMKHRNLGRVKIESGMIVIMDRDDFLACPVEPGEERLQEQVARREFSEFPLGHRPDAKAIMLPTGYGPGEFAVVASFRDNQLIEFAMFFLKGAAP